MVSDAFLLLKKDSINDKVTACDMKKVPLEIDTLDIAIFSLSLTGKNWREYTTESERCLVTNGILIIVDSLLQIL